MKAILLMLAATVLVAVFVLGAQPARGMPLASGALNLSNTAGDSRNPAIAVGDDGSRHVVWEETVVISPSLSLTQLWHRAWTGAAWTSVVSVSTGVEPAIAVGPDHTAHLAWVELFDGTDQVFYSRWNGASWSVPMLIAPGLTGDATAPVVGVDVSNTVYIAWGQGSGGYALYLASSSGGGTGLWNALSVPNASGDAPAMAIARDGTVHLAWQQAATVTHAIYYAALSGGTWSLPENISQRPGIDDATPSMALGEDGNPVVVWSGAPGGAYEVWSSRRAPVWSAPANVSNSPDDSGQPRIVQTRSDSVVMWDEATTPATIDWAFGARGAWTARKTLVAAGGDWGAVAPAAGPDGTVHYVYDGGPDLNNGDVFYDVVGLARVYLPLLRR